jgi:hypothetical protein
MNDSFWVGVYPECERKLSGYIAESLIEYCLKTIKFQPIT